MKNRGVVLVVEDEVLQRKYIEQILVAEGFTVVTAGRGDEALAVLNARDDISAVVTDIKMPGALDGFVVAWRARRQPRPIPVIVVSAFVHSGHDETSMNFLYLSKPINPKTLVQELMQALAKGESNRRD